jgi:hypothetical protein
MKKQMAILASLVIACAGYAAMQTLNDQDATKVGLQNAIPKIQDNFDEIYGGNFITGTLVLPRGVTLGFLRTNDFARIVQTNESGTADQPLVSITDARAGTTANSDGEATLKLSASGTTALYVAGGRATFDVTPICRDGLTVATNLSAGSATIGTLSGILKGTAGAISAASAGSDYIAPATPAYTNALALAGSALQPGMITVTAVTNAVDAGQITIANTLASKTTLVGWWSETAGGAAIDVGGFKAGANTVLLTATNSSTAVFTSHTDGSAVLDVYVPAAGTRYFNCVQRDGAIKSGAAMVFDGP